MPESSFSKSGLQNLHILLELRVKIVPQFVVIIQRPLHTLYGSGKMRVVSGSLQLAPTSGYTPRPSGRRCPQRSRNGGIGQVVVQHTATVCPRPAKRRLHVIFDLRRHRVECAPPQRVQRAGQRPRRMDGAGAALKKAAVSGPGGRGSGAGRAAAFAGPGSFCRTLPPRCGRQPQPPGDARGTDRTRTAPDPAVRRQQPPQPGAGKVEAVPCRNARQVIPVLAAAAGFHGHSGTSQGLERPAAKSVSSSKPLRTMLATFTPDRKRRYGD